MESPLERPRESRPAPNPTTAPRETGKLPYDPPASPARSPRRIRRPMCLLRRSGRILRSHRPSPGRRDKRGLEYRPMLPIMQLFKARSRDDNMDRLQRLSGYLATLGTGFILALLAHHWIPVSLPMISPLPCSVLPDPRGRPTARRAGPEPGNDADRHGNLCQWFLATSPIADQGSSRD
jgi:hypothetical protein